MKKLIYVSIALSLMLVLPFAFAIDQEELTDAIDTLYQMEHEVGELIDILNLAQQSNIREIILTPEQKQALRDAYDSKKGNLVTLYKELP